MKKINTPLTDNKINEIKINDKLLINGTIYTGRDAILPKLKYLIDNGRKNEINFDLKGSAFMHTAVSNAGIATTTSNKKEIENSIETLSKSGVKIHIGKGILNKKTVKTLHKNNSIYVVSPPVAALLTNCIKSKKCMMFKNEGIEACYKLKVENIPAIVAIAHGKTIFK